MEAFNQAIGENPQLITRELVGRPYLSPMLETGGAWQRHANIFFVREEGDPEDGWDYAVHEIWWLQLYFSQLH